MVAIVVRGFFGSVCAFKYYKIFFCVFACVCVCTTCVPAGHRGLKRVLDSLELELDG